VLACQGSTLEARFRRRAVRGKSLIGVADFFFGVSDGGAGIEFCRNGMLLTLGLGQSWQRFPPMARQGDTGGIACSDMGLALGPKRPSRDAGSVTRTSTNKCRAENCNGVGCPGLIEEDAGIRARVGFLAWYPAVDCAIVVLVLFFEMVYGVGVIKSWRTRRSGRST
jgi:hypothetical protein